MSAGRNEGTDAEALGTLIAEMLLPKAFTSDDPQETFAALTLLMDALKVALAIIGGKRVFLVWCLHKRWHLTQEAVGVIVGRTRERVGQMVRSYQHV